MADTTMAESSRKKPNVTFYFLVPAVVLKTTVDTLSDPTFNLTKKAMIHVDELGFEIMVRKDGSAKGKEGIGYVRVRASRLNEFQCSKPVRKMVNLDLVSDVLKDAATSAGYDEGGGSYRCLTILVFFEDDSNLLSFQFGASMVDFALGEPLCVGVADVEPEYGNTALDVSYGFDAVIPSTVLRKMISQLLQKESGERAKSASLFLHPGGVNMTVADVKLPAPVGEPYVVKLEWPYWELLERASHLSDKCYLYLMTDPTRHIMLRFNIGVLGDMVYLYPADFISVPELPCLGHFRSLAAI